VQPAGIMQLTIRSASLTAPPVRRFRQAHRDSRVAQGRAANARIAADSERGMVISADGKRTPGQRGPCFDE
jgi:hypothetical protein